MGKRNQKYSIHNIKDREILPFRHIPVGTTVQLLNDFEKTDYNPKILSGTIGIVKSDGSFLYTVGRTDYWCWPSEVRVLKTK